MTTVEIKKNHSNYVTMLEIETGKTYADLTRNDVIQVKETIKMLLDTDFNEDIYGIIVENKKPSAPAYVNIYKAYIDNINKMLQEINLKTYFEEFSLNADIIKDLTIKAYTTDTKEYSIFNVYYNRDIITKALSLLQLDIKEYFSVDLADEIIGRIAANNKLYTIPKYKEIIDTFLNNLRSMLEFRIQPKLRVQSSFDSNLEYTQIGKKYLIIKKLSLQEIKTNGFNCYVADISEDKFSQVKEIQQTITDYEPLRQAIIDLGGKVYRFNDNPKCNDTYGTDIITASTIKQI